MSININLGKKYFLQKLQRMKRSIFNVLRIFALKPLFSEKNEIKWNQTGRHTMGSFSQLKSSPIKWNQTDRHINCIKYLVVHDVQVVLFFSTVGTRLPGHQTRLWRRSIVPLTPTIEKSRYASTNCDDTAVTTVDSTIHSNACPPKEPHQVETLTASQ